MPYKNDDLDKLFQKAGRRYPLKTDNANWAKLSAKLQNSRKIAAKNNRKYAVILLLSIIAISSLSVYKFITNSKEVAHYNKTQQILSKATTIQNEVYKTETGLSAENNKVSIGIRKSDSQKHFLIAENNNAYKNDILIKNNHIEDIVNQENTFNNIDTKIKETIPEHTNSGITNLLAENVLADGKPKAEAENTGAENIASAQLTHVQLKPGRRIYGIAYGGPEFSIVKFQRTTNPGHRMGVALGYKINKRFNIELGLQREYLNFYSNGKYVDTSLLEMKKNTDVEKLDASSKITSVPITVRYNFLSNRNGHFFAALGINAVIITHSEHYNYDVLKNGMESNLSKKYNAVRNPKYFAGLNVSAGYQRKVSGSWSMKVEPYYQMPVNDFGVGRVPVSNFGVDFGILKDLK